MKTFKEFLTENETSIKGYKTLKEFSSEVKEANDIAKRFNWDLKKVEKFYIDKFKKQGVKNINWLIDYTTDDVLNVTLKSEDFGLSSFDVSLVFDEFEKSVNIEKTST